MARPGFIEITFQMEGQQALIKEFADWGNAITEQMQPAWEQVGELLQHDFAEQFAAEGGYLGAQLAPKWAQLRPSTVADRMRKGYPGAHPILQRSGEMRDSLVVRGAPGNVFEATPTSIRVGTASRIAPYHQRGTRKMDARKMVALRYETRPQIIRILGDFVRQLAAQAGLRATGGG